MKEKRFNSKITNQIEFDNKVQLMCEAFENYHRSRSSMHYYKVLELSRELNSVFVESLTGRSSSSLFDAIEQSQTGYHGSMKNESVADYFYKQNLD